MDQKENLEPKISLEKFSQMFLDVYFERDKVLCAVHPYLFICIYLFMYVRI